MGTPNFLDLIQPELKSHLFTIAIDKWGTGTWDFGKIDASKYTGPLHSVPVDDSCNTGGCWKAAHVKAQFGNRTVLPSGCAVFGKLFSPIHHCSIIDITTYRILCDPNAFKHMTNNYRLQTPDMT